MYVIDHIFIQFRYIGNKMTIDHIADLTIYPRTIHVYYICASLSENLV